MEIREVLEEAYRITNAPALGQLGAEIKTVIIDNPAVFEAKAKEAIRKGHDVKRAGRWLYDLAEWIWAMHPIQIRCAGHWVPLKRKV
jgi:hypothetical protein